jgi:thioredoxin reductase (NADPH)
MIYDAAIIGSGPAGLSAALVLKIHEKNFIWFGNKNLSDKIARAELINNYPGLPAITGEELNQAFKDHVENMGLEIDEQMVNQIMSLGDHYAVMAGSDFYEAKALIMATGVTAVGTLPGETDLVGKGVSYCATCDGDLYKGRTIAIVCNASRFEYEVKYLADLAEKVYYLPLYKDVAIAEDNIEILDAKAVKVNEENGRASGLTLSNKEHLNVDGIFFLREGVSLGTLLPSLALEDGHIAVNRSMETSLKGCFAAGDCTGRPYQYVKAAGEGNVAAHSTISYLSSLEN